ncbi:MAG: sigma-70 family RNA polymerase sigma factor [Myxococcota bacterium]
MKALATLMDEDNVVSFPPKEPAATDIASLFDAHAEYLCRVVHRLTGSRETAEDVVQDVFILAHQRRFELEDRVGIRTWLYRAAVNHVRHRRRSFVRYQGLLDRFQAQPTHLPDDSPDDLVDRHKHAQLIHACVQRLSDKQREVFVLYELEELEGAEIAQILEIPVNTVWSRLRLARAAFRKQWTRIAHVSEGQ